MPNNSQLAECAGCGLSVEPITPPPPCPMCGDPRQLRFIAGAAHGSSSAHGMLTVRTGREIRLEHRLQALLRSVENVRSTILDQDDAHVIVQKTPLDTALGFAKRDREDLESDRI